MTQNLSHLFPQDFLHKLINFPKETLKNLFMLCQEAVHLFITNELNALDPLVCENACHIRAFALWHMTNKYRDTSAFSVWHSVMQSFNTIIEKISALPPINEHTRQTIESYLQEHGLYLGFDNELLFDVKFIVLSYLLTLTKKQLPSSSFMLYEKTCLEALNGLGLVHNKIKSFVSSAQKELSFMSCQIIQRHSQLYDNPALMELLVIRYDDHKRSYLPQYPTAKVILLSALQHNIPLIIKVSRFVKHRYHDELLLGFTPSLDKKEFYLTPRFDNKCQAAIICEGIVNYPDGVERPETYVNRLNQQSPIQILLANFAAHPQFSGNLRNTPCIYKEAYENNSAFKAPIAQEWEAFNQHAYFAKKEGCTFENPSLLFLNHVFCDSITYYPLYDPTPRKYQELLFNETEL
ncbi:hypothetical protein Lbir_1967 [Legionella birminghamensis]|uniref:Uncharacterized protein n=2 Tax=Legionella birminghamensis TaxID=28083 RepID=A0A378JQU3_9GAMM|nr:MULTISPECIES: hypothetical protein [Legionella]KTC69827.1 hypothetical protein Lbir_1967 [Legionella birminghamensis]MCE3043670.1 hypothetical protein [Legionella sp. 16cNR16C]STX61025.1 Uncharacterised protein [Legionella birminghamensis]